MVLCWNIGAMAKINKIEFFVSQMKIEVIPLCLLCLDGHVPYGDIIPFITAHRDKIIAKNIELNKK